MSRKNKTIISLIAIVQIVLIAGFLVLEPLLQAIPGRYRVALAERVPFASNILESSIDAVIAAPTALPKPSTAGVITQQDAAIDVSSLLQLEPTLAATALIPTETADPTVTPTVAPTRAPDEPTPLPPTNTPEPTSTPTPEPLPESVILEGMGVIRQTFNNCGPANLTQVMNWYGSDLTQQDVASYLKPNREDRNVSPWQIVDYVNEQTFGQYEAQLFYGGTLEMLKTFIANEIPVVVEKGYEVPNDGWYGHYLTLYGYDDAEEIFYTQDSYLGPWDGSGRTDTYANIETYWQQFNYAFYVVYKPQQRGIVESIVGPDLLDPLTMWNVVAARAEGDSKSDPDSPFVWFSLGSALTRLGELTGEQQYYEAGAQAFDQAREIGLPPRMLWYQFRPYYAYNKVGRLQDVIDLADATLATQGGRNVEETFWHKGHALAGLGDIAGARNAYAQALEVNANFYPAQLSLDWANSVLNGS